MMKDLNLYISIIIIIEIRDYKKITYISFNLLNFILYELYFYLILPFKSKRVKSVK